MSSKISNSDLVGCLRDQSAFDTLYVAITQRAIEYYADGRRRKFALKLHGDLAALDQCRGQIQTAYQTFSSLPAHYSTSKHRWPPLEAFMLARALDSHTRLENEKDGAWLDTAIAFLGVCAEVEHIGGQYGTQDDVDIVLAGYEPETPITRSSDERKEYFLSLFANIRRVADKSNSEILKYNHPSFLVTVTNGNAELSKDQDGSTLSISISNFLPCNVEFDRVELQLAGEGDETLIYVTGAVVCYPGTTSTSLFCGDSHQGVFNVASASLWLSKVHFEWKPSASESKAPMTPQVVTPQSAQGLLRFPSTLHGQLVRVPLDKESLDIKISLPRSIQWDAEPAVMLELHTGRNVVQDATIDISSPQGVVFRPAEATLLEDSMGSESSAAFSFSPSGMIVRNLKSRQTISFTIPHSSPPAGVPLHVAIKVSYQVVDIISAEPQSRRTLRLSQKVQTSLPLQVSVMDSFRGKTLISKFTISSTSHLQVRVLETKLEGGTGLRIRCPKRTSKQPSLIITAQRPIHAIYQLTSEEPRYERETLYLHVTYRTLKEEIERRLDDEVASVFGEDDINGQLAKSFLIAALAANASWVQLYLHSGELALSAPADDKLGSDFRRGLNEVLERLKVPRAIDGVEETVKGWQHLIIPVDLPFMHILCAIQIHINADLDLIYAGQPVGVRIEITTSFHWGSIRHNESEDIVEFSMRYSVQELVTDWLVSGHKQGDFLAVNDGSHSVDLTLVPLHHGELALPTISVLPLAIDGQSKAGQLPSTETYHVHAAQRIMVLPRGGRSTFVVGMGGDM